MTCARLLQHALLQRALLPDTQTLLQPNNKRSASNIRPAHPIIDGRATRQGAASAQVLPRQACVGRRRHACSSACDDPCRRAAARSLEVRDCLCQHQHVSPGLAPCNICSPPGHAPGPRHPRTQHTTEHLRSSAAQWADMTHSPLRAQHVPSTESYPPNQALSRLPPSGMARFRSWPRRFGPGSQNIV